MDFWALVIACAAALFTGLQWVESHRARVAADRANDLARRVEARQKSEEERSAVMWRAQMHPEYRWIVQLENTGHSTAHQVRIHHEELSEVRHRHLSTSWTVEPGESHRLEVREPMDLADMPALVKVSFKLDERSKVEKTLNVSLSGLRDTFRRLAADDHRRSVEQPIRYAVEREMQERKLQELLDESPSSQQSRPTFGRPTAIERPPAAAPGPPEAPSEEQPTE